MLLYCTRVCCVHIVHCTRACLCFLCTHFMFFVYMHVCCVFCAYVCTCVFTCGQYSGLDSRIENKVLTNMQCFSTVNNESLVWLKFGKSACYASWQMKVWQIYYIANSEQYKNSKLASKNLAYFLVPPNLPN